MRTIFQQETQWRISSAYANYFARGRRHPDRVMREHDLVYILEGAWEIYVEGQPYLVKRDQVILLPAGVRHYGLIPCADGTRTMYIHACERQEKAEEGESVPIRTLTDCAGEPGIRRDFERIVTEFASGHSCRGSSSATMLRHIGSVKSPPKRLLQLFSGKW